MMIGNLSYVSAVQQRQTHSLNTAEALSRLRYWTGEPTTEDRPHAKPVIKLLIDALERHFTENSAFPCAFPTM